MIRRLFLTALLVLSFVWAGIAAPNDALAMAVSDHPASHEPLRAAAGEAEAGFHVHRIAGKSDRSCCHANIACVSAYDVCSRSDAIVAVRFVSSDATWLARARRGANVAEPEVLTPPPRPAAA